MKDIEDNDVENRKALFNAFACCKYYKASKAGKVLSCKKIDIQYVSVDKNGNVYVDWEDGDKYRTCLETAEVNVVWHACHNYVEGVFTSKDEAIATAKEWFAEEKKAKIAELEEELAQLKASI